MTSIPCSQLLWSQILGAEARARVPADFIVQNPDVANPPTLFLALADMAQAVATASVGRSSESTSSRTEDLNFLQAGACISTRCLPTFGCLHALALMLHPCWWQPSHACRPGLAGSCAPSRASSRAASVGVAVSMLRNLTQS